MKISTLAAIAAIGAAFTFMAPSAEAMPRIGTAPANAVSDAGTVQLAHGRHCRIRRGHRSRCRRGGRRHTHRHCHRHRCHYHRHRSGHHGHHRGRRRGNGVGIYLQF